MGRSLEEIKRCADHASENLHREGKWGRRRSSKRFRQWQKAMCRMLDAYHQAVLRSRYRSVFEGVKITPALKRMLEAKEQARQFRLNCLENQALEPPTPAQEETE